jgi:hypothetical protein
MPVSLFQLPTKIHYQEPPTTTRRISHKILSHELTKKMYFLKRIHRIHIDDDLQ